MQQPEEWMRRFLLDKRPPETIGQLEQGLRERYRTGWFERGIPLADCENSLEHSNSLGLEAALYAKHIHPITHPTSPRLEPEVMRRKAKRHDVSDDFALDIPPHYGMTKEKKFALEWYAVQLATSKLGKLGEEIREDWLDIALCRTPEAVPTTQLDKLATVPRSLSYKRKYPELWSKQLGLRDFHPYARARLTSYEGTPFHCPTLIAIADKLMKEEYSQDPVQQYHLLLSLGGDMERFDRLMQKRDAGLFLIHGEQPRVMHVE